MALFEVKLEATCTVLVEAETQEEASKIAWEDADFGEFELVEGTTSDALIDPSWIDILRRHADKVIE